MALYQVSQSFRSFLGDFNLVDAFGQTPFVSSWTAGANLVDVVNLQSTLSSNWQLISASVQGYLGLVNLDGIGGNAFGPVFGQFGKVMASLILKPDIAASGGSFGINTVVPPYQTPMIPLPTDATFTVPLWDPAIDDLPPTIGSPASPPPAGPQPYHQANTLLSVSASILLPIPMKIEPGQQVCMGIWMLPSLLGMSGSSFAPGSLWHFALAVLQSNITLNIDDGG